jgi:hypothetical protein
MPKFTVVCREVMFYGIEVEAESMDEAESKAEDIDVNDPEARGVDRLDGEWEVVSVTDEAQKKTRHYTDGIMEEDDGT